VKTGNFPLVTVGIPTYNRPESLRRTLEYITAQSYNNLEIIVSDNCSPGHDTEALVQEFINKDSRICFYRQTENMGAVFNFKFVLAKSLGEYFMWAADDDKWSNCFIEKIMRVFQSGEKKYVAVATEAQYIDNNLNKYDFFSEGRPFYKFYSEKKMDRLAYMIRHNYGNLVYGIFLSSALKKNDSRFALNEIPLLLQVAEQGNFKVLPDIEFYKNPPSYQTYLQAKWEKTGGNLPLVPGTVAYNKNLKPIFFYHFTAFKNIRDSINTLNLTALQRAELISRSFYSLSMHFVYMVIRYKPRKA
jgi:glycosyltransferase involved in cell wall biosynthesis